LGTAQKIVVRLRCTLYSYAYYTL